jgi:hypothetical protein
VSVKQWKDNIKVDLNELKCEIVGWFQLAYDEIYFRLLRGRQCIFMLNNGEFIDELSASKLIKKTISWRR